MRSCLLFMAVRISGSRSPCWLSVSKGPAERRPDADRPLFRPDISVLLGIGRTHNAIPWPSCRRSGHAFCQGCGTQSMPPPVDAHGRWEASHLSTNGVMYLNPRVKWFSQLSCLEVEFED